MAAAIDQVTPSADLKEVSAADALPQGKLC
jgi:hypothetical protein